MTNINKLIGYVGTYTKGESNGIYTFILDTEEGKIEGVHTAAQIENPTYLTISNHNGYMYSVCKEGEKGGIAAFKLNSLTGELAPINRQMLLGAAPCHVSLDGKNRFAFSANYHKGTVESYLIDQEDGSVLPAASIIQHEGNGPDPRQEKPHTHFAGVTPNEKYIAAVELGSDAVITYEVNEDAVLKEVSRLKVNPGSGPRHLVFHPNHQFAYCMTEFSSEVIFLTYNQTNGQFTAKQYISTIPADFTENNQGSAIQISQDSRFIYAGNRGHNSIAQFSVNQESGELSFVDRYSTEGNWPRDFSLDPSGRFIVASNQESSNLVLFSRSPESGRLTLLQSDIHVPDPVCVKFIHY